MANYAPRSPDLSGASYAPRSPDLSGLSSAPAPTSQYAPRSPNLHPAQDVIMPMQPLAAGGGYAQPVPPSYATQNYLNVPGATAQLQTNQQTLAHHTSHPQTPSTKPRARKASSTDDLSYSPYGASTGAPSASKPAGPGRGRRKKQKIEEEVEEEPGKPAPGALEGIEVRTKFPVARIKRIMQHDEEVGKVSQVTPTAVSKALELFMISIVLKSANAARAKNSKKVTVGHMKQVVAEEPEFDFLSSVCEKYADTAPTKGKKKKEEVEESDD